MTVTWYVARDSDGSVSHLLRVHRTDEALWGEYFQDGHWTEDPSVLDVLMDGSRGSPVSPEEGQAIERSLGASGAGA